MFLENDRAELVIPQGSDQEDEHDDDTEDPRGNGQPGQERVHVTRTVVTGAAWLRI